jgi:hypothetical protein
MMAQTKKTENTHPHDKFAPDTRANALAEDAASAFVRRAINHANLYSEAGDEMLSLTAHLERTRLAYVIDAHERHEAAEAEASFMVGVAIGARLGGAR